MRKWLIAVLVAVLLITGCQTQEQTTDVKRELEQAVNVQQNDDGASVKTSEEESFSGMEAWTLESFLGDSAERLTADQSLVVQSYLDQINELEQDFDESQEKQLNYLYDSLMQELESFGIDVSEFAEEAFEPWTPETYILLGYEKLNEEQLQEVQLFLDRINEAEAQGQDQETVRELYLELNALLRDFGLQVPVDSMKTVTEVYADAFTDSQKERLIELENELNALDQDDEAQDKALQLQEEIEVLLNQCGLNAEQIFEEMETGSISLADFKVNDKGLELSGDGSQMSEGELEMYRQLVSRASLLIPDDQEKWLYRFGVNTDGKDNVLAYVNPQDDNLIRWSMVLDAKDAFDENGKYMEEYDETIVHEFGHLISLHASQMQEQSEGTYENEEGILAKQSYLNQFYQTFWTDIAREFKETVDPMDTSGQSALAFYDKHVDQFVSDYAATNPEEDFAETFRVFVFGEKPSGKEVKEQKVKWMYEQAELVQLRSQILNQING